MTAPQSNRLPVLAEEIRKAHADVQDAAKTAAGRAIAAGEALIEAKALLKHGEWLPWLREHCALSERTAQLYARLARKHREMDGPDAQRVADLPIREAAKIIADTHGHVPMPGKGATEQEIWSWAEQQIRAPFNKSDFESASSVRSKLLDRVGVSDVVSFVQGLDTNIPVMRLVPTADALDALDRLWPIASAKCPADDLDFDFAGMSSLKAANLVQMVNIVAMHVSGGLLLELEDREKLYGEAPAEASDACWRDRDKVLDELTAGLDDTLKRNERFRASGNHKALARVGTHIRRGRHKKKAAEPTEVVGNGECRQETQAEARSRESDGDAPF